MKILMLLIPLILVISCSDKTTHLADKNNKYQRFLSQKANITLNKELKSYEK